MARFAAKRARLGLVKILTLRVPDSTLRQLDALTERMKKLPTTDEETFVKADVTRIALRRGLELLEKEISKVELATKPKRTQAAKSKR